MRTLYLFVNNYHPEWLDCLSLTDDGYILGNHICSSINYMANDLHDRPDRLKKIKEHFKDERYEIEIVTYEECKTHSLFKEALNLANKREQDFQKVNATIEVTYE